MASESTFQIALPSLDDDDQEELFSYPTPRFGHPSVSTGSGQWDNPYKPHARDSSMASSDAYGPGGGGGATSGNSHHSQPHRKDSVATSNGSAGDSSFSFPQSRSTSSVGAGAGGGFSTQRSISGGVSSSSSIAGGHSSSRVTGGSTSGGGGFAPPPTLKEVSKKSSFVSLKSAFSKSAASATHALDRTVSASAVPPLPDSHNYPALRNPFSRNGSSSHTLNSHNLPSSFTSTGGAGGLRKKGGRPSTASSGGGGTTSALWSASHSISQPGHYSRPSQFSHATSVVGGWARSTTTSPPPLPSTTRRVGGAGGGRPPQSSFSSLADFNQAGSALILPAPTTPPQFALNILLRLFNEITTQHLKTLVSASVFPLSAPVPPLPSLLGPGADPKLDGVLDSLGLVATSGGGKSASGGKEPAEAKAVLDSLISWRNSTIADELGRGDVRSHMAASSITSVSEAAAALNERIQHAATYILLRAILSIVRQMPSKEVLGDALGIKIEDLCWRWVIKERDLDALARSPSRLANRNLLVELVGSLVNLRFLTFSDRFLRELRAGIDAGVGTGTGASAKSEREAECRLEMIIRAMGGFKLKVYPPEDFDMGAEFLVELATDFSQTHGTILKVAYAEILRYIIHPIANTATAEVNHPHWAKAVSTVLAQATKLAAKDKYWGVSFPLVVSALCVSPRELFMDQWQTVLHSAVLKVKERSARPIIANSIMRLLWVYLNRCTGESNATLTKTLDSVLRTCFPLRQRLIVPTELPLDPFVNFIHYLLVRQFDYGRDFVLQLLAENRLGGGGGPAVGSSVSSDALVTPERMTVAVRAILLTLRSMEKDVRIPSFPSNPDFNSFDYATDYESSGATLPDSFASKPGMQEFLDRLGPLLGTIALHADAQVGGMSVFEDRFFTGRSHARHLSESGRSTDLTEGLLYVRHGLLSLSYPRSQKPYFELYRAVLDSWPRLLHSSVDNGQTLQIVSRATAHVDPDVADAATLALKRLAESGGRAEAVAVAFSRFLCGPEKIFREGQVGLKAYEQQAERIVRLWIDLLSSWVSEFREAPAAAAAAGGDLRAPVENEVLVELEATALFLLSSTARPIRTLSLVALEAIANLQQLSDVSTNPPTERAFHLLQTEGLRPNVFAVIPESATSTTDRLRLETFMDPIPGDFLMSWAKSDNATDTTLWWLYLPTLVGRMQEKTPRTMFIFRTLIGRTFLDWRTVISSINSSARATTPSTPTMSRPRTTSTPRPSSDYANLADQWKIYVAILCATTSLEGESASSSASPVGSSASANRDPEAERLAMSSVLLPHLIPLLSSENVRFREAVVMGLGYITQPILPGLLKTLSGILGHLQNDFARSKPIAQTTPQTRLFIAVAHVYSRISPLIRDPRSLNDVETVQLMLRFVRETHHFLLGPEVKDNFELHRLRRYFCVIVQNIADGLATVERPDRFFSSELRCAIFRSCDDWCSLGRRSDIAQARESRTLLAANESYRDSRDRGAMLSAVATELRMLSSNAASAMAALCQGTVFFSEFQSRDSTAGALNTRSIGESNISLIHRGVDLSAVLQWIRTLFSSSVAFSHEIGRKALSSLLTFNSEWAPLLDEVIHQACAEGDQFGLRRCFFAYVADAIVGPKPPALSESQKACLALIKLGHPDIAIRRHAFNLFEFLQRDTSGQLARLQPAVGSSAPNVYLEAQRKLAEIWAAEHASEAGSALLECTLRITQVEAARRPVILSICPAFLTRIDLTRPASAAGDASVIPSHLILSNLLFIAVRFGEGHFSAMQAIWNSLACGPFPQNCNALVKFLIQQSSRRSSAEFVTHAKQVLASLAESSVGLTIFDDLCGFIEPGAMVQSPEVEEDRRASAVDALYILPDLDTVFPPGAKSGSLSTGQLALLFVGEMMLDRANDEKLDPRLATLLHATLLQVDHPTTLVRQQAQMLLFRILWAWTSDAPDPDDLEEVTSLRKQINDLWDDRATLFWPQDGPEPVIPDESGAPKKIQQLVDRVLAILEPFYPEVRDVWGALAVDWATSCPNRTLACRSFQLFRVLRPTIAPKMLADMLGRLSNTIADPLPDNNAFCIEILFSFCGIVRSVDTDFLLQHPQLFWCAAACLSTTVEKEFLVVLELLNTILDRLDLQDEEVVNALLDSQPPYWCGDDLRLQVLILPGLRSADTDQATFELLARLARLEQPALIDFGIERTLHLYTAALPWLLHANDTTPLSESIITLATDIGRIAEAEGKPSIARIMTSFAKGRFRTKDDFLRQAVGCLREHFLAGHAFDVITNLLAFTLNSRDWMREKTMQVLKLVFQSHEAREPLTTYGAELLMPLLRLLGTPLAPQALDVLNEPITIAGGPAASQVLRMSMSIGAHLRGFGENAGEVFGTPEESGWCIARLEEQSASARQNALAVFETCPVGARVQSMAHFSMQFVGAETYPYGGNNSQASLESFAPSVSTEEISLGQLVGDLHSLHQFFDEDEEDEDESSPYDFSRRHPSNHTGVTSDSASERRVANILRRSMARTPSTSSVQDYERARLSMSVLTPPFGPPYTTLPQSDSPSGASSDDEHGAATPSLGLAEDVRGSQSAPPSRQGSDDRALPHQNRARSGDVLDEDSEFGEDDLDQAFGLEEWEKIAGHVSSPVGMSASANMDSSMKDGRRALRGLLLKARPSA